MSANPITAINVTPIRPPVPPRPIGEIVADLSREIPARLLKSKTVGRGNGARQVAYLPWHSAVKYLDLFAPGWSYEIKSVSAVGDLCAVVARIRVQTSDGPVWREATGSEPLDTGAWGDPTSNAESMALRRAAAKFGLGLYLYACK